MADWVTSKGGMADFISLVVVCAPDEFPEEDYLPAEQQLTLKKAFAELEYGLDNFIKPSCTDAQYRGLKQLLQRSRKSYEAGGDVEGAHLLQQFEALAFG